MEREFMNFVHNTLLNFDALGSIFVMLHYELLLFMHHN